MTEVIFARNALLPDGWRKNVRIEIGGDGRIASAVADVAADDLEQFPVILPAQGNLHSHTFQRAMAGLAETRSPSGRDSFWTWREVMYRFLDLLTPDDIEAIAAFAFMEMQEAGFASVAEFHYLHHQPGGVAHADIGELSGRIAAAAGATGIGLTLLPVLYRQGGVDGRPLKGGQARFGNDLKSFALICERAASCLSHLPSDAGLGIAPHSLRAVSRDDLEVATRMLPARPLHMHIAEQEAEVEETLAAWGARPMTWLLDNFEVDARWCLIHCTHMKPEETIRLAATGAVAGLCPVTEANLGDGIFDGQRYLAAGGRVGVGSDSNIRISVADELRQLEYSQRLRDRSRAILAAPGASVGRRLYDAALAGSAQALGRDSGAIAPGMFADLVALAETPFTSAGDRCLDEWIFARGRGSVSDVWSAGRRMVQEARHLRREPIAARYRAAIAGIMERL